MSRVILVATSGGHLTQLHTLSKRMSFTERPMWITVDSPQSRSLLSSEEVLFLPYSAPRDVIGVIKNSVVIARYLRNIRIERIVSTGAGLALSCVPLALLQRKDYIYIESATRVSGLSLTGRVISLVPGMTRYVQYPHLVNSKWKNSFSVFDEFSIEPTRNTESPDSLNVFITVGANKNYGFRRLMESMSRVLPTDACVFVQYGPTDMTDIDYEGTASLSSADMVKRIDWADVVVSHAGTGSALSALKRGKLPILVPRRFDEGEHIDNHQADLADYLRGRGLAIIRHPEELSYNDLLQAARMNVRTCASLTPIKL